MFRVVCVLSLAIPLAAQAPFRSTRHAGLPTILWGDKFAAGDLDGDGAIDLFVVNDNSPNQLLLNDGRGGFVDATAGRFVMQPGHNASHSVDLVDIDGDGDLDILIGNDDFISNRVYLNNGFGFFTDVTATALPVNLEFTMNQVIADFDGDGRPDWFTVDLGACHLYRNNGAGGFVDVSSTALSGLPANLGDRYQVTPHAADVDGDGDLDVLVPGPSGPFLIVNQGGVLMPTPVPLPNMSPGDSWFADIDGDGDPDILAADGTRVLRNQGNGTFVDVTAVALPGLRPGIFACFDVDGDGDVDLISAQGVLFNNGAGVFVLQPAAIQWTWGHRLGAAAADFDGDGDIDLPALPNFRRQVDAPSAPVHGNSYAVDFHAAVGPNSLMVAAAALGGGALPFGPLGTLRLDPNTMVVLAAAPVLQSPMRLSFSLPPNPGIVGMQLHYQAYFADPVLGAHLSNAIRDIVQ